MSYFLVDNFQELKAHPHVAKLSRYVTYFKVSLVLGSPSLKYVHGELRYPFKL